MNVCIPSLLSLLSLSCLGIVHAGSAAALADESEANSSIELIRFPIEEGKPILLPVEVLGEKQEFVLDTGSALTVLDVALRDRLIPSSATGTAMGLGGSSAIKLYDAPELKIGAQKSFTIRPSRKMVTVTDFSDLREASNSKCNGIIGVDCLDSLVLRFNFDEKFVAFQSSPTLLPAHVEKIRIDRMIGSPSMTVQVSDSVLCSMMIDCGCDSAVILESKLFNQLVQKKRIRVRGTMKVAVFDRVTTVRSGVLDRVTVGPYQIRNVPVSEGQYSVMGLLILKRFDTEVDFPNRRVFFRPSLQFDAPDRWNCAGFEVKRVDGRIVVEVAFEGRAAERSGIATGDVILQINGMPAADLSLEEIGELTGMPETELKLTVERDGQSREIVFTLEKVPEFPPAEGEFPDFKRIPD